MNKRQILQKINALDTEGKDVIVLYNEISEIVAEAAYKLSLIHI